MNKWEHRYHPLGIWHGYSDDNDKQEITESFKGQYLEWRLAK